MEKNIKMKSEALNFYYGNFHALKDINLTFPEKHVTALIGPSGCGKSTYLRCFNRMNDLIKDIKVDGGIYLGSQEIHDPKLDVVELRRRVGMVFQKPNPFPKTIYENIAYAPRIHGLVSKGSEMDDLVESSLIKAGLFLKRLKTGLNLRQPHYQADSSRDSASQEHWLWSQRFSLWTSLLQLLTQ